DALRRDRIELGGLGIGAPGTVDSRVLSSRNLFDDGGDAAVELPVQVARSDHPAFTRPDWGIIDRCADDSTTNHAVAGHYLVHPQHETPRGSHVRQDELRRLAVLSDDDRSTLDGHAFGEWIVAQSDVRGGRRNGRRPGPGVALRLVLGFLGLLGR